jgi:hypothetical protein
LQRQFNVKKAAWQRRHWAIAKMMPTASRISARNEFGRDKKNLLNLFSFFKVDEFISTLVEMLNSASTCKCLKITLKLLNFLNQKENFPNIQVEGDIPP